MDFQFASIAVLVAVSIGAYFLITHVVHGSYHKNWKNSPPGPVGWPLLGSLPHLSIRLHEDFLKLSKIHGPLFSLKLGLKPVIVVSSPEMACKIFRQHDAVFSNHITTEAFRIMSYDGVSIISSPVGTRWRALRRILMEEVFSPKALKAFAPIRQQQVHGVLKQMYSTSMKKNPVNIADWAFIITLANLLSNIVCSKSLFDCTKKEGRELKETLWELNKIVGTPNIADLIPLLKPFDLQGLKQRTLKIFWFLDAFYEKLINDKLEDKAMEINKSTKKEKLDMLDVLLEYRSDRHDELRSLSRNVIKGLLSDIFVAGTETISSTIEWSMTEIFRTPDVYKNIVVELDQVVGKDRFVEEDDIANLPYLQAAVKEVFRLHPAAPLLHRQAIEACEVSGYHIPKGCNAFVNVWAIGRDLSIWEEPCKFKPERFIGSSIDVKGQDFNLLPFGSGRRSCVGLPLAHRMVHFYLAALLHAFEWECPLEILDSMEETLGTTIQKDKSLIAIPKPRLSSFVYL